MIWQPCIYSPLLTILVTILVFQLSPALMAQEITGSIFGTVTDETGKVVPGVEVTAIEQSTDFERAGISNDEGVYSIQLLPVGNYIVRASLPGFKTFVGQNIPLELNQNLRVDVQLQVGEITEEVTVSAAPPLIETRSSALGKVMDERQIEELPLDGRNFLQLISLQPGTVPAESFSASSSIDAPGLPGGIQNVPSVGGSRMSSNAFLLDGANNNDAGMNAASAVPSPEALREFKVITNSYSAEFGNGAGSVVNVLTESGGNQFHGSLYEFFRNDVLDARNFFAEETEPLRQNQFGGDIGGPIIKNRTFFFVHYEGFRFRRSFGRLASVPSLLERQGIFGGFIQDPATGEPFPDGIIPPDRIHPTSAALLQFYPEPSEPTGNTVPIQVADSTDLDQFTVRIDHSLTENNSFFGRYFFNDGLINEGSDLPAFSVNHTIRSQNLVLQDTHVFSERLINTFRFGYNRLGTKTDRPANPRDRSAFGFTFPLPPVAVDDIPAVSISGLSTIGNPADAVDRFNNIFSLQDHVNYIAGRHTFKFGFEGARKEFNYGFFPGTNGALVFVGAFAFNPFADFLLGHPFVMFQTGGDPFRNWRANSTALYIQDEFHVRPGFTLNLGLRYDYEQPVYDLGERAVQFVPGMESTICPNCPAGLVFEGDPGIPQGTIFPDKNNFAPRVGFAWDLFGDGRTSLRSAYGVFYDLAANINVTNLSIGCPFNCLVLTIPVLPPGDIADPYAGNSPFEGGRSFIDDVASGSSLSPIDMNIRTGYVQQWHLTLQHSIRPDLVFEIGYVGNKGTKLWGVNEQNPGEFVPNESTSRNILARRPFGPEYGEIRRTKGIFNSNYNSLQSSLRKRFSGGLSFLASYTWSKSIDQVSSQTVQLMRLRGQSGKYPQDPNNLAAERGLSAFDVPHRFVISYLWELPFFKDASGWRRAVLGGWQINGITSFQDGTPFTVFDTSDRNFDGIQDDRPNLVGDPELDEPTPDRWFNTDAFTQIPLAENVKTFGNAGRNILRSGGINRWDFSIFKNFQIMEETTLQFRTEIFNLFNHPTNFDVPENNLNSPNFGRVLNTRTFSQRVIQFALKLQF